MTIGRELLRGGLTGAVKSLLASDEMVVPGNYRGMTGPAQWIFGGNGIDYWFKYSGHQSSLTAYEMCPPVNAIINRKAQAYINGKSFVLNTQGKESSTPDAKKIKALMAKPNALQSWKQFEAQGYIYQQLFGYNIVLPIKPFGFKDNIDATSLWNIPPSMIDIEETNKLFYQTDTSGIIKELVLNYKGTRTVIKVADVFIMKDYTPSFNSLVIPESRIKALALPINNIIGAYESRYVIINKRGALGILSHDPGRGEYGSLPMTNEQKAELQADFSKYGLRGHQWQFIITTAALKWQAMGQSVKELMLIEEVEESTVACCAGLNFPPFILGLRDTTYSNMNAAEKGLYQNSIIPDAENNYEQWNHFFGLAERNLEFVKDFCHLPVLQEDDLSKAQARKARNDAYLIEWQNNLITRNQWRIANGDDPVPGDDLYYDDVKPEQNEGQAQSGQAGSGSQPQSEEENN